MNETTHALKHIIYGDTKEPICVMAKTFNGGGCEQF